ncbi:MAG: hypothetical protein RLP44_10550 [Aggregatilineales bacterium]
MGISVQWFAPGTNIISFTIDGKWVWDDFQGAMKTAYEMMESAHFEYVDYILDMRNGDALPSNILSKMKNVSQRHHPKSRDMVVVGAGRFPEMMFGLMMKIVPDRMKHVKLVSSMDDAIQHLESQYSPA